MANVLGITVEDLSKSFEGELDDDEVMLAWYERKIDEAVRLLIAKVPNLVACIAAASIDQSTVEDIVLRCVHRVLRNIEGLESESEDGYAVKYNKLAASGDLWYPDGDIALICKTNQPKKLRKAVSHRIDFSGWGAF